MKHIINILVCALSLAFGASQAQAAGYTFTDLGTLGGSSAVAYAINGSGQVAGLI